MSPLRIGIAASALFLVVLVANTPARLIGHFVKSDVLVMRGFSGTIWRGRAAKASLAVGHGYLHVGAVRWKLSVLSLLGLSPKVSVRSRWGAQTVSGDVTYRGAQHYELDNLKANFPASLLRQISPLEVKGNLVVDLSELEILDGLPVLAEGRIMWENAAWSSSAAVVPLGSYAANFNQILNQPLRGEVLTISGPVEASGLFALDGKKYTVDILLGNESGLDPNLQQAISLLAQPVDAGYRIQLDSQMP